MNGYKKLLWKTFESTGLVRDYLKFKIVEDKTTIEAGEDFGFDKNIGNRAEDHQVR